MPRPTFFTILAWVELLTYITLHTLVNQSSNRNGRNPIRRSQHAQWMTLADGMDQPTSSTAPRLGELSMLPVDRRTRDQHRTYAIDPRTQWMTLTDAQPTAAIIHCALTWCEMMRRCAMRRGCYRYVTQLLLYRLPIA